MSEFEFDPFDGYELGTFLADEVKVVLTPLAVSLGMSVPRYATEGSAGLDLAACMEDRAEVIHPGEFKLVKCGFSMQMPSHLEAQVRPRSGLALKRGVTVLNSPGTIDSDFMGEIGVILINHGREEFWFSQLDRIAQMVFSVVARPKLEIVLSLNQTTRGQGGFGSTGI